MSRMETLRAHPYPAALIGAFILIAVGTFIVYRQSAVLPAAEPSAWGGSGTLFAPEATPTARPADTALPGLGGRDVPLYHYRPPASSEEESSFDFDTFIASLSASTAAEETDTSATSNPAFSYSFIPTGLISTTTPTRQRSPLEETLYRYGNEVGAYIQTYEGTHRSNSTIITNHIEDRADAAKAAAVRAIGADIRALGMSLEAVDGVPEIFATAHNALADSYIETGLKLSAMADANGDQAFIAAINTYSAAVDSFIKNYVAVATLFSVNNVRFGPGDAGSVFTFSGQ